MKSGVLCIALVAAVALVGCGESGPTLYEAEGTVTYNGAPVADAVVNFGFDDGQTSVATTGPDGKFNITTNGRPGAPLGSAVVAITKFGGATMMTPEQMMASAQKGEATTAKSAIPEKYADPKTSGLKAEIVAGGKDKNKFTFPLVD